MNQTAPSAALDDLGVMSHNLGVYVDKNNITHTASVCTQVLLGIFLKSESNYEDMVDIMESLHEYVPLILPFPKWPLHWNSTHTCTYASQIECRICLLCHLNIKRKKKSNLRIFTLRLVFAFSGSYIAWSCVQVWDRPDASWSPTYLQRNNVLFFFNTHSNVFFQYTHTYRAVVLRNDSRFRALLTCSTLVCVRPTLFFPPSEVELLPNLLDLPEIDP